MASLLSEKIDNFNNIQAETTKNKYSRWIKVAVILAVFIIILGLSFFIIIKFGIKKNIPASNISSSIVSVKEERTVNEENSLPQQQQHIIKKESLQESKTTTDTSNLIKKKPHLSSPLSVITKKYTVPDYLKLPLATFPTPPLHRLNADPLAGRTKFVRADIDLSKYESKFIPPLIKPDDKAAHNFSVVKVQLDQPYHLVIEQETVIKLNKYLTLLKNQDMSKKDSKIPGNRMITEAIPKIKKPVQEWNLDDLVQALTYTRFPCKYAEEDRSWFNLWYYDEVGLLGDLSLVIHALAIDDGVWFGIHKMHPEPFPILMGFVAGCLGLKGSEDSDNFPDYDEFFNNMRPDGLDGYTSLLIRRILPVFRSFSDTLKAKDRREGKTPGTYHRAIVTVPSIGCGHFVQDLEKEGVSYRFTNTIRFIVRTFGHQFANLDIWLDRWSPRYVENHYDIQGDICNDGTRASLFSRSLYDKRCKGLPQLMPPSEYASYIADVYKVDRSYDMLCTLVSWDHYSFPGNDWLINSRNTDDGNKGASTTELYSITQHSGYYDGEGYKCRANEYWEDYVKDNKTVIYSLGRTIVYDKNQESKLQQGVLLKDIPVLTDVAV